jgi:hypothetical protein
MLGLVLSELFLTAIMALALAKQSRRALVSRHRHAIRLQVDFTEFGEVARHTHFVNLAQK